LDDFLVLVNDLLCFNIVSIQNYYA